MKLVILILQITILFFCANSSADEVSSKNSSSVPENTTINPEYASIIKSTKNAGKFISAIPDVSGATKGAGGMLGGVASTLSLGNSVIECSESSTSSKQSDSCLDAAKHGADVLKYGSQGMAYAGSVVAASAVPGLKLLSDTTSFSVDYAKGKRAWESGDPDDAVLNFAKATEKAGDFYLTGTNPLAGGAKAFADAACDQLYGNSCIISGMKLQNERIKQQAIRDQDYFDKTGCFFTESEFGSVENCDQNKIDELEKQQISEKNKAFDIMQQANMAAETLGKSNEMQVQSQAAESSETSAPKFMEVLSAALQTAAEVKRQNEQRRPIKNDTSPNVSNSYSGTSYCPTCGVQQVPTSSNNTPSRACSDCAYSRP